MPINSNKSINGIEKIEKKYCGVFDLVLIFGCSGCGKISGFSSWFEFMFKNSGNINTILCNINNTSQIKVPTISRSKDGRFLDKN